MVSFPFSGGLLLMFLDGLLFGGALVLVVLCSRRSGFSDSVLILYALQAVFFLFAGFIFLFVGWTFDVLTMLGILLLHSAVILSMVKDLMMINNDGRADKL